MAKGIYVGAGGVARRMKKAYVGVAGKARAVLERCTSASGNRARLCYSAEPEYAGTGVPLAAPKYGAKAAAAGNTALIGGGRFAGTASNAVCNTVDAYDTSLTRTAPAALGDKRYLHSAVPLGAHALFAGGTATPTARGGYNTVDAYDASLTRTSAAALSRMRTRMGCTVLGSRALFAGGGHGRPYHGRRFHDRGCLR